MNGGGSAAGSSPATDALQLAGEPTGTLATGTGDEIMQVFIDLKAQGQTIFNVTHNPGTPHSLTAQFTYGMDTR